MATPGYGYPKRPDAPARTIPSQTPPSRVTGPSSAEGRRVNEAAKAGMTLAEVEALIEEMDRLVDVTWTPHLNAAVGAALPTAWRGRGENPANVFWATFASGGGTAPTVQVLGGRRCGRCNPSAGGISGARLTLAPAHWDRLRTTGISIYSPPPRNRKSLNYEATIARLATGGAKATGQGLWLAPTTGSLPGMPTAGNGAFGILGDGAGGWQFFSRLAGGITIQEALTWPTLTTNWVRVRLQLVHADNRSDSDGMVRVFVNDALLKEYTDMTKFSPISDLWNATGYDVMISDENGAVETLHFCDVRAWVGTADR